MLFLYFVVYQFFDNTLYILCFHYDFYCLYSYLGIQVICLFNWEPGLLTDAVPLSLKLEFSAFFISSS